MRGSIRDADYTMSIPGSRRFVTCTVAGRGSLGLHLEIEAESCQALIKQTPDAAGLVALQNPGVIQAGDALEAINGEKVATITAFDEDGDGSISTDELIAAIERMGLREMWLTTHAQDAELDDAALARAILAEYDADGSGELDGEEVWNFLGLVLNSIIGRILSAPRDPPLRMTFSRSAVVYVASRIAVPVKVSSAVQRLGIKLTLDGPTCLPMLEAAPKATGLIELENPGALRMNDILESINGAQCASITAFDEDGDGRISHEELRAAVATMELRSIWRESVEFETAKLEIDGMSNDEVASAILRKFDADGSGDLDSDEVVAFFQVIMDASVATLQNAQRPMLLVFSRTVLVPDYHHAEHAAQYNATLERLHASYTVQRKRTLQSGACVPLFTLKVAEVSEWLISLELALFAAPFASDEYDGQILADEEFGMDDIDELTVGKKPHRRKLLKAIHRARELGVAVELVPSLLGREYEGGSDDGAATTSVVDLDDLPMSPLPPAKEIVDLDAWRPNVAHAQPRVVPLSVSAVPLIVPMTATAPLLAYTGPAKLGKSRDVDEEDLDDLNGGVAPRVPRQKRTKTKKTKKKNRGKVGLRAGPRRRVSLSNPMDDVASGDSEEDEEHDDSGSEGNVSVLGAGLSPLDVGARRSRGSNSSLFDGEDSTFTPPAPQDNVADAAAASFAFERTTPSPGATGAERARWRARLGGGAVLSVPSRRLSLTGRVDL